MQISKSQILKEAEQCLKEKGANSFFTESHRDMVLGLMAAFALQKLAEYLKEVRGAQSLPR